MASSDFINIAYQALGEFNRESVGFIPSVDMNANVSRAAIGQTIRAPRSEAGASSDIVPNMTAPSGTTPTDDYVDVVIEKSKSVKISMGDPDTNQAEKDSGTYNELMIRRFESAYRTLANELELYTAGKAAIGASRATGTAGTTPFAGTDMMDFARLNQILTDNGCPQTDRQLVLNSTAFSNLSGKNGNLFKVGDFGSADFIHTGFTAQPLYGFKIWQSAQFVTHAADTGTAYVTDGDVAAKGKSFVLKTGTGNITAGNYVTFAGDDNKYVVGTGVTAAGTMIINAPGARSAVASGTAVTANATAFLPSLAFHKSAIVLGVRKPYVGEGDEANFVFDVFDAKSGITFEVRQYGGYHTGMIEVGIAYGAKVVQAENVALLLG